MNTEEYDDDKEFNGWLEDEQGILHILAQGSPIMDWIEHFNHDCMVEYLEGTVPSDSDPRLVVYEEYLNNKKG